MSLIEMLSTHITQILRCGLVVSICLLGARPDCIWARLLDAPAAEQDAAETDRPPYTTETVRGRFVWLSDGLKELFGIETETEPPQSGLALMTPDKQLISLVEDNRGKAFRVDARLREMELELLVRRYRGAPAVQIVRMHEIREDGKFIVDYWCDICAIPMFVDGPCDCCQEPNRLRRRPVKDSP